jgi:peptidyl-prolyl cis-trans isomerase SurA
MKSLRLLAATGLAVVASVLAPTFASAAQAIDRIVVVVNDGVILQSELENALAEGRQQIRQRGIAAPPEEVLRAQVLERLVLVRLQTQRAQEAGIRIDDRELNEVLNNIAAQNKMTLAEFAEAVRKDGQDFLAIREQVRDEVVMSRLRNREIEGRVLVTDQDIDLFLANQGEGSDREYRLSHILVAVPDGAKAEVRDQLRKKAEDLLTKLQGGADFAGLAIASSDGQQALEGGDFGWRRADAMPELFAQQLPRLKPGQLSGLLETASGYHIIKLIDERSGGERAKVDETHAQHILLQTNAIRDEEQTKQQARELHDRLKTGADFTELAKKYSDDPGSKASGGDLGWAASGIFAPDFQTQIDALKDGEMSAPFRSSFGWHIARVLERRSRDVTEETRRGRARTAIQNRKVAEEYDGWLRKLRQEAYVEYRLEKAGADKSPGTKSESPAS